MKVVFHKIIRAYDRFKNHPITKKSSIYSFLRYYIWFNFISNLKEYYSFKWINNVKLKIKKGDAGLVGNYYYGLNEFEESLFLLHYTVNTDIFLDIGANLGHYSLLLSGVNGCRSYAIEPVPTTFNRLNDLIKLNNLNSLIKSLNIGVSDKEGELYFSTNKGTMNCIVTNEYLNKELVIVKPIDEITTEPINILKIDVEGSEKFALDGAIKTLQSNELNILILEINSSGLNYNITDDEIFNFVIENGFKPYIYNHLKKELIEINKPNKESFNTIFIKNIDFTRNRLKLSKNIKIRSNFY